MNGLPDSSNSAAFRGGNISSGGFITGLACGSYIPDGNRYSIAF